MSLVGILNGRSSISNEFKEIIKEITPIKKEFKTISGKEAFGKEYTYKAGNKLSKVSYASVSGIAFDYIARFVISSILNNDDAMDGLVSERGLSRLLWSYRTTEEDRGKLENKYESGLKVIKEYIDKKVEMNKEIIEATCYLARLEQIFRCGMLPENIKETLIDKEKEEIIEDVYNLFKTFNEDFIGNGLVKKDSKVIFNPHFSRCSFLVGGADADIIVDGTLYDFKTSKKRGYSGKDAQQLVSYYLFNYINEEDLGKIKRIALYKARFGEIEYFDINNIDKKILEDIAQKMKELLKF